MINSFIESRLLPLIIIHNNAMMASSIMNANKPRVKSLHIYRKSLLWGTTKSPKDFGKTTIGWCLIGIQACKYSSGLLAFTRVAICTQEYVLKHYLNEASSTSSIKRNSFVNILYKSYDVLLCAMKNENNYKKTSF